MKSRVHPKYKTKYRVGNWRAYERALVQRGNVTLWLSPDARADPNALCNDVAFDIDRYLAARKDATIKTFGDWVSHARFRDDASRAGAENWLALKDHLAPGKPSVSLAATLGVWRSSA